MTERRLNQKAKLCCRVAQLELPCSASLEEVEDRAVLLMGQEIPVLRGSLEILKAREAARKTIWERILLDGVPGVPV